MSEKITGKYTRVQKQVLRLKEQFGGILINTVDISNMVADALILAMPAYRTAQILAGLDKSISTDLGAIPYSCGITVILVYPRGKIAHPLTGFGYVVPSAEGKVVSGCTFSSVKFEGRAPAGKTALRAFIGGKEARRIMNQDNRDILTKVKNELSAAIGISAEPDFTLLRRFPYSLPHYQVGHLERLFAIEERMLKYPSIDLAGNGYRGTGIPDCVHSGEQAAEKITAHFRNLMPEKQTVS